MVARPPARRIASDASRSHLEFLGLEGCAGAQCRREAGRQQQGGRPARHRDFWQSFLGDRDRLQSLPSSTLEGCKLDGAWRPPLAPRQSAIRN